LPCPAQTPGPSFATCEWKINWEPEDYRHKILKTVREPLKQKKHANIKVLGHKAIVYQSIFLSGPQVVITPYFMSGEKQNPPVLVFRDHGQDSFAAKLERDIEVLEKSAVDISNYSQPLSAFYQYQGIPIGGDDAVCEHMIKLLKQTRHHLDVTHIAKDKSSIDYIGEQAFRAWLEINYAAARGEGGPTIRIRRLFLINRQYEHERVLQDTMEQMSGNGIEVYSVYLDEVGPDMHEDFSLYDDRDVMFRHQRRRSWISESGVSHSTEQKAVTAFRHLFDRLLKQAMRVKAR
jgi:L-rhamnose mutarotase